MPTMCVTNVAEYPVNKLGTQSVFALEWKPEMMVFYYIEQIYVHTWNLYFFKIGVNITFYLVLYIEDVNNIVLKNTCWLSTYFTTY